MWVRARPNYLLHYRLVNVILVCFTENTDIRGITGGRRRMVRWRSWHPTKRLVINGAACKYWMPVERFESRMAARPGHSFPSHRFDNRSCMCWNDISGHGPVRVINFSTEINHWLLSVRWFVWNDALRFDDSEFFYALRVYSIAILRWTKDRKVHK